MRAKEQRDADPQRGAQAARRGAASAVAALALVAAAPASAAIGHAWDFVSQQHLHPVRLDVRVDRTRTPAGYIFVAPIGNMADRAPFYGQPGPLIVDGSGDPVWQYRLPRGQLAMDFAPQVYDGRPVLTWWQGTLLLRTGTGFGEGEIFDSRYHRIATVRAPRGFTMDPHEFRLTPRGSALFPAYRSVRRDLSAFGGARNGQVHDAVVEEEDVRTHRVVWRWDVLRHVPLSESSTRPSGSAPWDVFHLNSIDLDSNGNALVSLRNTSTLYYVDRRSGRIVWRLGGRHSSFKLTRGAHFSGQHEARFGPDGTISLFDNGIGPPPHAESRGLIVALDTVHHIARLVRAYGHRPPLLAPNQGSFEPLAGGGAFAGWGRTAYVSQFDARGRLVFDARFPGRDETYRAVLAPWVGEPAGRPSIGVRGGAVYASWNGATQVARWRIVCGGTAAALRAVGGGARTGFETRVPVPRCGRYLAADALDAAGRHLARSAVVRAG